MLCTAKRSNGQPCKASAIRGGRVCVTHGGSAPQVRDAARRRILELVDPALGVLARAVRPRAKKSWEPTPTEMRAVIEILNRSGLNGAPDSTPGDDPRATWEEFITIYRKHARGGNAEA